MLKALLILPLLLQVHPPTVHPARPEVAHGEMQLLDVDGSGGTDITVASAGTYYGMAAFVVGHIDQNVLFEENATADRLVLGVSGDWLIAVHASFSGDSNSVVICKVFTDGAANDHLVFIRKLGANGDVGAASLAGIDEFAAGSYVDLRCTADGNADVINFWAVNVSAVYVQD